MPVWPEDTWDEYTRFWGRPIYRWRGYFVVKTRHGARRFNTLTEAKEFIKRRKKR